MAQLSDDCFAFGGPLMPVEAAAALIGERVAAVDGEETVGLAAALGRVTAAALTSPLALPPFDNSAVDGFAVRHADLAPSGDTLLPVAARVPAGAAAPAHRPGHATRIFTGAPMPAGADTVFMQEDTLLKGDQVLLPAGLKPGANRRLAGEDVRAGAPLLPAGRRLRAQDLALAAAVGLTDLAVRRRPRVALFSTGDAYQPGAPLGPAGIHDSNRVLLAALLAGESVAVTDLGILRDEPAALAEALVEAASRHDLVLTSGGVSTGEEDHVKAAVERAGHLVFWRIAIKPGRPVAMGVLPGPAGQSAAFVGLPGNPVAVFVTYTFVVKPLLARLSGTVPELPRPLAVVAGFSYRKKAGRREYVRVSVTADSAGRLIARKHVQDGAGVLTSLTETDGLIELEDDRERVEPGEILRFHAYRALA